LRDEVIPDAIMLRGSDRMRRRRKIVQLLKGALGGKQLWRSGHRKRAGGPIQKHARGGSHKEK
jgi:hypothetical protein